MSCVHKKYSNKWQNHLKCSNYLFWILRWQVGCFWVNKIQAVNNSHLREICNYPEIIIWTISTHLRLSYNNITIFRPRTWTPPNSSVFSREFRVVPISDTIRTPPDTGGQTQLFLLLLQTVVSVNWNCLSCWSISVVSSRPDVTTF